MLVARMEELRNSYILGRKYEGKIPLWRPKHRWENNIKVNLKRSTVWTGFIWLRIASIKDGILVT
jgi:hypothetical protein